MATVISVHVRLLKREIVAGRLAAYFGSAQGKLSSIAPLLLLLILYGYRTSHSLGHLQPWRIVVPLLACAFALPAAFAFAGINAPSTQRLVQNGQSYVFQETGFES